MFAGNAMAGFLAVSIVGHARTLSLRDPAYGSPASSSSTVRFGDVARLGGGAAEGEPAMLADRRHDPALLIPIGGRGWASANLIAGLAAR